MSYLQHLSKDKQLKKILRHQEEIVLTRHKNLFLHLVASIISQQLSTKVAEVIYNRFLDLFPTKNIKPQDVLKLKFEKLKSIGLSNSKTHYVRNVAQFAIDYGLDAKKLNKMSEEQLIDYLCQIKGVGRWTAEIQLMFTLGCENVMPYDDLGIQQAMIKLYDLEGLDKKELKAAIQKITEKWSPYSTYAAMHLWRWKDAASK